MALRKKSLFLYDYEVTPFNQNIDFRSVLAGPILKATLKLGFYSLSGLMREIERAMQAADPDFEYTVTANRTILGGLENRITITTTSTYLDILFLTGPRAASSIAPTIGFLTTDYTGNTTYTGTFTSGKVIFSTLAGYNYLGSEFHRKQFGTVNISASGVKEAIVFQTQKFVQVQFKYETTAKILNDFQPFFDWGSKQRLFEFVPEYDQPNNFYEVTFEKTSADGKGLAYQFNEMLPDFPDHYETGMILMRINEV